MQTYPVCLVGLDSRPVIVVGGGAVAARKVQGLLEAGARAVTVISPALAADFVPLVEGGDVTWKARAYEYGDLAGVFLAIAATDDREVNAAVSREAASACCLVNVVDDPDLSTFILPAVVRRGELTVAISTGGASPALARRIRERFEVEIGPEYAVLAALLAELRPLLRETGETAESRLAAALRLVDSDLLDIITDEGLVAARERALQLLGAKVPKTSHGSGLAA